MLSFFCAKKNHKITPGRGPDEPGGGGGVIIMRVIIINNEKYLDKNLMCDISDSKT